MYEKSFLLSVRTLALFVSAVAAMSASGNFNLCDKQYCLTKSTASFEIFGVIDRAGILSMSETIYANSCLFLAPKYNSAHTTSLTTISCGAICSKTLQIASSGLAKRRLSLHVLRATSVHVRTSLSAGLLPPLRRCWHFCSSN